MKKYDRLTSDKATAKDFDRILKEELYERLKAYEDTGLSPEQIKEMDKLYLEKCREADSCNATIRRLKAYTEALKGGKGEDHDAEGWE